jgi:chromate transporter
MTAAAPGEEVGAAPARAPRPLPPGEREPWGSFLRTMGWIGLNTFGGPVAQIGVMQREAVDRRNWLTDGELVHLINFANLIPGPEALEIAIHLGYLRRGVAGGIAAGLLFIWPGFVSLTLLAWLYESHGRSAHVMAALDGIRPVALALVAAAAVRLAGRSLRGGVSYLIMGAAFAASYLARAPFLAILAGCGLLGPALLRRRAERGDGAHAARGGARGRHGWLFAALVIAVVGATQLRARLGDRGGATAPAAATASAVAAGATARARPAVRLRDVAWLETKTALVTFGGAYTALPYLREQAVVRHRWLTDAEMVDALALGETTPGPLISIGVFIAYLAAGLPGAIIGGVFLFLPAFVLVLTLGRHIERIERMPHASAVLWGFSAGTLGLILALAANLVGPSVPDAFAVALAAAAFVAVWRFDVNLLVVVACGATAGLIRTALVG